MTPLGGVIKEVSIRIKGVNKHNLSLQDFTALPFMEEVFHKIFITKLQTKEVVYIVNMISIVSLRIKGVNK